MSKLGVTLGPSWAIRKEFRVSHGLGIAIRQCMSPQTIPPFREINTCRRRCAECIIFDDVVDVPTNLDRVRIPTAGFMEGIEIRFKKGEHGNVYSFFVDHWYEWIRFDIMPQYIQEHIPKAFGIVRFLYHPVGRSYIEGRVRFYVIPLCFVFKPSLLWVLPLNMTKWSYTRIASLLGGKTGRWLGEIVQ